jgi:hypothetical protein
MDGRALDVGFSQALLHELLDGPWPDIPAELGMEEMLVGNVGPLGQVALDDFKGLLVEGDGALAPPLAADLDIAHLDHADLTGELDIGQGQVGKLEQAFAGLHYELDDRRVPHAAPNA